MNYLLSVSAEAEHPNLVNPPKGVCEARQGADPSNERCREPKALETRRQLRAAHNASAWVTSQRSPRYVGAVSGPDGRFVTTNVAVGDHEVSVHYIGPTWATSRSESYSKLRDFPSGSRTIEIPPGVIERTSCPASRSCCS